MSDQKTQLQQLVSVALRTKISALVALVLAAATAVVVFTIQSRSTPSLCSAQAIAVVRRAATSDHTGVYVAIENKMEPNGFLEKPFFSREPLDVIDYATLLKSDEILADIAEAYKKHHPDSALSPARLRDMLSVVTTLNAKTPYDTRYYSTIIMKTTGRSPELTLELTELWADAAETRIGQISKELHKATKTYIENAYDQQHKLLAGIEKPLPDDEEKDPRQEASTMCDIAISERLLEALAYARLQADFLESNSPSEFQIVSRPLFVTFAGQTPASVAAITAMVIVFLALWSAAMVVAVFQDIAKSLSPSGNS